MNVPDSNHRPKGHTSLSSPPNRFQKIHAEPDFDHFENDAESLEEHRSIATEFLPDTSKSIISENESPDVPFRYSLNPYRGCEHGCAYCYARPTHEYLGLNAGLDFESKILGPIWKSEPVSIVKTEPVGAAGGGRFKRGVRRRARHEGHFAE